MKFLQKLNAILVKIGIIQETRFSMTEHQIRKQGKIHWRNILSSLYMKFYPIWSRCCKELALDGMIDKQTDRRTEGWTDRQNGYYMLTHWGA